MSLRFALCAGVTAAVVATLLVDAHQAQAVGDAQPLTFAEDTVHEQLQRRLMGVAKGRLQWIYLDEHVLTSPLMRSPDSIIVGRKQGSNGAELIELNGWGRVSQRVRLPGGLWTDPVLDTLGRIVVVDHRGKARCLDPRFKRHWELNVQRPSKTPPVADIGGALIFTGRIGHTTRVTSQGRLDWQHKAGGTNHSPAAVARDGSVYVCTGTGKQLLKLTPQGKLAWSRQVGLCDRQPQLLASGAVVLATHGRLLSFTASGKLQWQRTVAGKGGPPVAGPDGSINLVSTSGMLHSVSGKGDLKWSFPVGKSTHPSRPVFGPQGDLYVASPQGYLLVISPAGTLRWYAKVPNPAPRVAVRADGSVLVSAVSDSVRLIRPPMRTRIGARP